MAGGKGGKKKDNSTENVRVVVRTRPMSGSEQDNGCEEVMRVGPDKTSIQVLMPTDEDFTGAARQTVKKFALDGCLDQSTTQQQCFDKSGVKALLDSALEGFSATVFAYGQTGSGKTYTMTGGIGEEGEGLEPSGPVAHEKDGVIPRSIRYIFDQVAARQDTVKYTIRASFLEIYNEQVRDLWNPASGSLSIREYPPGYWRGFYVEDLYIFECTNVEDMLFMLTEGMSHRAVGSHNLNKDSSRSHSMLTFYLESEEEENGDPYVKFGKISFVDLAGSERLKETQSGFNSTQDFQATFRSRARMKGDEMLKETGNINKSLFTLGKVISALGDASKASSPHYVPYRDSKLTKLLMDSLGGASKALMFACCSPADSYLEETLNTLQYAARTRNITNKPAVQVDPHEELVRELRRQLKDTTTQNSMLRNALQRCVQLEDCPESIKHLVESTLANVEEPDGDWQGQLEDAGGAPGDYDQVPPPRQERRGRGAGKSGEKASGGRRSLGNAPSQQQQPSRGRRHSDAGSDFDFEADGRTDDPYGGDPYKSAGGGGGRRGAEGRRGRGRRGDKHRSSDPREQMYSSVGDLGELLGPGSGGSSGSSSSTGGDFSWDEPPSQQQAAPRGRQRGGRRSGGDDASAWLEEAPRSAHGSRHGQPRSSITEGGGGQQGGTEDPFLPDSLLDGSSDWKAELDDEARELYRELGLALYKATSQTEMSAAMKGLQQFERDHREASQKRGGGSRGGSAAAEGDPDQAFRQMAMSFYRDDSGNANRGAKSVLAAQRRRSGASTPINDAT